MLTALDTAFGRSNLMGFIPRFQNREATPIKDIYTSQGRYVTGALGESVGVDYRDMSRKLGTSASLEAPAVAAHVEGDDVQYHSWQEFFETSFIPSTKIYLDLRQPGMVDGNRAAFEIGWRLEHLFKRLNLAMEFSCAEHLMNVNGLTFSSTVAPGTTVPFTKRYTDAAGNGIRAFTVGASWATAGTKIITGAAELQSIENTLSNAEGKEVGTFIFGRKVRDYFIGNTEVKDWFQRTPQGLQLFTDRNLNGLAGVSMWREMNHVYEDQNGNATKFVVDDRFCVLPSQLEDVLQFWEGQVDVPADQFVGQPNPGQIQLVNGPAVYATIETNPPGIRIFLRHRYLPVVTRPRAITLIADVTAP